MEKLCVFCGQRPRAKNQEHVIPQWLIKITGDPGRQAYLGRSWHSPALEKREFTWKAFTFPACTVCNDKYAKLEGAAKSVLEPMLGYEAVGAQQLDILLDWLDKVRTGLWLGKRYLNKNYRGLAPMFHISQRVGSKDRYLIVYRVDDDGEAGIGIGGTETPLFDYIPSCFTLMINNLQFLNVSYDFILAHRFGFPYVKSRKMRSGGGEWIEMNPGVELQKFPLVERRLKTGGTQVFQPMVPWSHFKGEGDADDHIRNLYDRPFVRERCMDYERGRGKVYWRVGKWLKEYPETPSTAWVPKQRFARGELMYQTGIIAGEILEELFRDSADLDALPEDERTSIESQRKGALALHSKVMGHFLGQKDMYSKPNSSR